MVVFLYKKNLIMDEYNNDLSLFEDDDLGAVGGAGGDDEEKEEASPLGTDDDDEDEKEGGLGDDTGETVPDESSEY